MNATVATSTPPRQDLFISRLVQRDQFWFLMDGSKIARGEGAVLPIFSDEASARRYALSHGMDSTVEWKPLDHLFETLIPRCLEDGVLIAPDWDGGPVRPTEVFARLQGAYAERIAA